jgi:hypothetical protein
VDITFIVADRTVTPDNWRSFGPDVTRARLDRLADAVQDAAEEITCATHRSDPVITCRGPGLAQLDFEVAGCCPTFNTALAEHLRRKVKPERILEQVPGAGVKQTGRHRWRQLNRAFGPILAGLVIDSVDLFTFGPLKRFIGLPAGALAGYWMGSIFRLPLRQRLLCALAAGVYCMIPGLEFIPLATLIGAYVRFREGAGTD